MRAVGGEDVEASSPAIVLGPSFAMPKFAALAGFLAALASPSLAQGLSGLLQLPNTFPNLTACLSQPSFFSCENTTAIQNTCCSPTPGGLGEFNTLLTDPMNSHCDF